MMVPAAFEPAPQLAGTFGKQWRFPPSGTAQARVGIDSARAYYETR